MTLSVCTVFGTRPEAIKMAPVVLRLGRTADVRTTVCITGQHRQMLDPVLELFNIQPDIDLDVMQNGQDLYDVTSRVLVGMRDAFSHLRPDVVLVHGDTTTCFASALAAFYAGIPIGHVEAGLRTGNLRAPFPEEANRSLVARLAQFHFAPTGSARTNLLREGVPEHSILVTGNTVIDALLSVRDTAVGFDTSHWERYFEPDLLRHLANSDLPVVLITGHRRENFGRGFVDLCSAIRSLAIANPDCAFVYPVHLNPNVQRPVGALLAGVHNIHLVAPLDYLPFVYLMNRSRLVLTDSGGIQEEAPALGKPVLVMRDVTERPEAVTAGAVKLVGTNLELIVSSTQTLLHDEIAYQRMSKAVSPYGDGNASERIVAALLRAMETGSLP